MAHQEKQARAAARRGDTMKKIILLGTDNVYCSSCGTKHGPADVKIGKRGVKSHIITCHGCGRCDAIWQEAAQ